MSAVQKGITLTAQIFSFETKKYLHKTNIINILRYYIKSVRTVPMFRKNETHRQKNIFGFTNTLPTAVIDKAKGTEEYHFYHLIFCHIDEEIFSVLYSDEKSRPNAPINSLVGAIILQNRRGWTFDELFKQLQFNLLVRFALGLDDLETMPFCRSTLFNFQNRLSEHFTRTGENLLEHVFDRLTENQLRTLKVKTSIQRTDSTFAASNIRNYTRLQLLVETLIRTERILSKKDSKRFREHLGCYVKSSSGQYIYRLKASDIPHELEKIAQAYAWVRRHFKKHYKDDPVFSVFERIFNEQFTIQNGSLIPRPPEELHSGCVQSPDDLEATYRDKNGKKSKGQTINVTETAHPENDLNLLTDIHITPNNIDDSRVLNDRIDHLKEKTSDLDEHHIDGAYGSAGNDKKYEKHHINPVQTGIRGARAKVDIKIDHSGEENYQVCCPYQKATVHKLRNNYRATFEGAKCRDCPVLNKCPVLSTSKGRIFDFNHEDYLRHKRLKAREKLPPERKSLRNNVEATIHEFTCRMPGGKLKVRGHFKTSLFAYAVGISSNFGRIFRYLTNPEADHTVIREYFKELTGYTVEFFLLLRKLLFPIHHEWYSYHIL